MRRIVLILSALLAIHCGGGLLVAEPNDGGGGDAGHGGAHKQCVPTITTEKDAAVCEGEACCADGG